MKILGSVIVFALTMGALPALAQGKSEYLTGVDRETVITTARQSCVARERESPYNKPYNLSQTQIAVFCECKINLLADEIPANRMLEFGSANISRDLMEKADAIIKRCITVMATLR